MNYLIGASELPWQAIGSGGGLSIAAGIIFYLLKFFLPKIIDSFRDELQAQRESHQQVASAITDTLKEEREDMKRSLASLEATQRETMGALTRRQDAFGDILIRHDAQVRGQNPQVTGSHEEMRRQWDDRVDK